MKPTYEPVIGLEIHAELITNSKMFCGCSADYASAPEPNTNICPVCTGLPGAMPVANKKAIELAALVGLALNCSVNKHNTFARKNYYYPDLPKGYQISQYELPICEKGWLDIDSGSSSGAASATYRDPSRVRIRRVHIEEDTAKLFHEKNYALVDFNRAGVPLLEIVSEPDMRSVEAALDYATKVRAILRYLGVNSGNMEKGVLRFEANISVRPFGSDEFRTRTEIKNLNSFRALTRASAYEIERQIKIYESGGTVVQETLGWDDVRGVTTSQRSKEEAHDYRYFPEPDLPPLQLSDSWIAEIKSRLPELPEAKRNRLIGLGLSAYEASVLVADRPVADYFEAAVNGGAEPKKAANWIINELFARMNKAALPSESIAETKVTPAALAELIKLVDGGTINNNAAKKVLDALFEQGGTPAEVVRQLGLEQTQDTALIEAAIIKVLDANADEVARFCGGEEKVLKFLIGQVMREGRGKFPAELTNTLLSDQLKKRC